MKNQSESFPTEPHASEQHQSAGCGNGARRSGDGKGSDHHEGDLGCVEIATAAAASKMDRQNRASPPEYLTK